MAEYPAARRTRQPTHPGAILRKDVLPALQLSVKDAAETLNISRQTLHAILSERSGITAGMAVRIGKLCGNGPTLWMRMQAAHDLWLAEHALADEVSRIPTLKAA
jgi:addiction module HigA family antidote